MSASTSAALATTRSPTNGGFLPRSSRNKWLFTFNSCRHHHHCHQRQPYSFILRGSPSSSSSSPHSLYMNVCMYSFLPVLGAEKMSRRNSTNDSNITELAPEPITQKSDADTIVDGMDFGELCNEFECISSPLVESTARQLVRDILELREGNRALGTFAISVKYKDPVRSFTGREKYKRQLWVTGALDNPSVSVQEMVMLSTSVLSIKWTIRGKPKSFLASIGGDLVLKVNSKFTLNQISGQVIEHEEFWDLSASSPIAQAFFWASRRVYATTEAVKDLNDLTKNLNNRISTAQENPEIYPDPSGDPTKFFQRDDGFQRDLYQIALFLAVVYLVVQFLRTTL